jgi:hypothetical protein
MAHTFLLKNIPEGLVDFDIQTTSASDHFEWDFYLFSLQQSAKLMMDSISIDSKLTFLKKKIDAVHIGNIQAEGFENLMVIHISSGSRIGKCFILCFVIPGFLAVLTAKIFTSQGLDCQTTTVAITSS